jgi:hypothetical protein
LNSNEYLAQRWGHDWTPIEVTQYRQFYCYHSQLAPKEEGVKVGRRLTRDECTAIAQRIAGLLREHRASRVGEKNRIEGELETAAKDAFSFRGNGLCHVTLQAAALMG